MYETCGRDTGSKPRSSKSRWRTLIIAGEKKRATLSAACCVWQHDRTESLQGRTFIYLWIIRAGRRWMDVFLRGKTDPQKTVKLIKMNNVLIHVIMLTVMCPPCLSHQQSHCRLSFTLLHHPPHLCLWLILLLLLSISRVSSSSTLLHTVFWPLGEEWVLLLKPLFETLDANNKLFLHGSNKISKLPADKLHIPPLICHGCHVSATVFTLSSSYSSSPMTLWYSHLS